jgi:hypothetical protein
MKMIKALSHLSEKVQGRHPEGMLAISPGSHSDPGILSHSPTGDPVVFVKVRTFDFESVLGTGKEYTFLQ